MEGLHPNYKIFPLGDSGATIDLGNSISLKLNKKVRSMQEWFANHPLEGIKDLIAGYSSLSILYDPVLIKKKYNLSTTAFEFIRSKLLEAWNGSSDSMPGLNGHLIRIPVCYDDEFAPDLDLVSEYTGLPKDEIIRKHCERTYYIYMIGFLPGFSYMAELDEALVVPRKSNPIIVAAGSVGIAGSQTGIYPLQCPGGWQIIGRTPRKLFNQDALLPVSLNAGDQVEFYPISKEQFV